MAARILSYAYSEGPDAGPTARYQSNQTICVIEQATSGVETYARPTSPKLFTDLRTGWAATLNAHAPAGQYTILYNALTARVVVQSTNGTHFRPKMVGSAAQYLGFTQDLSGAAGWATSWTGASAPLAVCELVGCTVQPPEDGAKVETTRYRHGRMWPVGWGNTLLYKVTLWIRQQDAQHLSAGWCVTGRIRLYQDTANITQYAATNLGGYVDGFVVSAANLRAYGAAEDFLSLDMTLAVAR